MIAMIADPASPFFFARLEGLRAAVLIVGQLLSSGVLIACLAKPPRVPGVYFGILIGVLTALIILQIFFSIAFSFLLP